jgi:hypothetical protein
VGNDFKLVRGHLAVEIGCGLDIGLPSAKSLLSGQWNPHRRKGGRGRRMRIPKWPLGPKIPVGPNMAPLEKASGMLN